MLGPEDVENLQPLFEYFESMVQHHSIFLRDLEHRIVVWESRGEETHRIGDVMLKNMVVLPIYEEYIEVHRENLQRLNDLFTSDDRFQQIYKEFEQEKVCLCRANVERLLLTSDTYSRFATFQSASFYLSLSTVCFNIKC